MPTQGGLINTNALAIQYDRTAQDPRDDSAMGLWNRLLNDNFNGDSWIVTSKNLRLDSTRPGFVIEKVLPTGTYISAIVTEPKPQHQTMLQGQPVDNQALENAISALNSGRSRGQQKVFVLRVVGTQMMAFKVTVDEPFLMPLTEDFMDVKIHGVNTVQIFDQIKSANVLEP
ncbi:hypothetical protein MferCBS31731_006906 [Microsporum ferrugineum]